MEDALRQIIQIQKEQLDRYHEYMLMALSNNRAGGNMAQNFLSHSSQSSHYIPFQQFMLDNLENMPLESMYMFFETAENVDHGVIALLENVLCPDKENLQFCPQQGGSFVRYNNGITIVTESIQIFAKFVCDYIHNFCRPHIEGSNTELKKELEEPDEEDCEVMDTRCKKNMMRVKHLTNLLISSEQVRLVKKLFSILKSK